MFCTMTKLEYVQRPRLKTSDIQPWNEPKWYDLFLLTPSFRLVCGCENLTPIHCSLFKAKNKTQFKAVINCYLMPFNVMWPYTIRQQQKENHNLISNSGQISNPITRGLFASTVLFPPSPPLILNTGTLSTQCSVQFKHCKGHSIYYWPLNY